MAVVVALLVGVAVPAWSAPGDLEAKRREAARLEAQISQQGERLSMAQEDFNDAAYQRQRLDARLSGVRRELAVAEARWTKLKEQLGQRVRILYKRPGFWADSLLSARSLNELARARTLSSSVLLADTELIYETEKARVEMAAVAEQISELRSVAAQKERELAGIRARVEREMQSQRALLGQVQGEIAEIREAQRQRELQQASQRAAEEARRRAQQPSVGTASTPRSSPGAEQNIPPPRAARASAGQAVQAAASQLGKDYCWGGTGPDCYDCSGLTQWAWAQAGVSIPRSSRAQYAGLPKVPRDQIQPGDLLFYGNPIHHVGIYEGNGIMINSPQTGETVRRSSINRRDYTGAARP